MQDASGFGRLVPPTGTECAPALWIASSIGVPRTFDRRTVSQLPYASPCEPVRSSAMIASSTISPSPELNLPDMDTNSKGTWR